MPTRHPAGLRIEFFFSSRSMPTAIAEHLQVFDEAPSSALPPVSMARSPRGPRSRGKKTIRARPNPVLVRRSPGGGPSQRAAAERKSFSFYANISGAIPNSECRRAWGRCEGIGASDSVWVFEELSARMASPSPDRQLSAPNGQPLARSPSVADMAPKQKGNPSLGPTAWTWDCPPGSRAALRRSRWPTPCDRLARRRWDGSAL